jgi:hypothetical protein
MGDQPIFIPKKIGGIGGIGGFGGFIFPSISSATHCTAQVLTGLTGCPRPRMAAFESCKACASCQQYALPQENAARRAATKRPFGQDAQDEQDSEIQERE